MIFLIMLGADLLNVFLALTQMPTELARWVGSLGLAPLAIIFTIVAIYLFLGCIMDSLSMLLLTIPIFFPIVMGIDYLGLDPESKAIWFDPGKWERRLPAGFSNWSAACRNKRRLLAGI